MIQREHLPVRFVAAEQHPGGAAFFHRVAGVEAIQRFQPVGFTQRIMIRQPLFDVIPYERHRNPVIHMHRFAVADLWQQDTLCIRLYKRPEVLDKGCHIYPPHSR